MDIDIDWISGSAFKLSCLNSGIFWRVGETQVTFHVAYRLGHRGLDEKCQPDGTHFWELDDPDVFQMLAGEVPDSAIGGERERSPWSAEGSSVAR